MKVSLNLATPLGWHERYRLAVGTLVLAVALGVLGSLVRSAVANYREDQSVATSYAQAHQRLVRLQKRVSSLQQYLARPELHRLVEETTYLNGLIERKQFSVAGLTARVSQLLPPDVRVDGLSFSVTAPHPIVHLSVEAKSERAFEAFLNNLEGAADFSDVVVANQGFADTDTPGNSSTVLATCTAKYHGAGIIAEGQGITDAQTSP